MTTDVAAICAFCNGPLDQQARSIAARLSQDQSFAALWQRLDRAERDRDRMLNALQLVLSEITKGNIVAKPKHKTLINRALSRIQPVRAALQQNDEGEGRDGTGA